jgi:hypothetical protein
MPVNRESRAMTRVGWRKCGAVESSLAASVGVKDPVTNTPLACAGGGIIRYGKEMVRERLTRAYSGEFTEDILEGIDQILSKSAKSHRKRYGSVAEQLEIKSR